ncbi:MAG: DUF2723 domain-containing protein [Muribaculaceae bacterium]|nr:DUF2723 domain-containing protein [Muribaculaceae bacterium]
MKKYNIINNSLGWLCFVIAAVTYLLTLEPTASFWDCPEFIAQGTKLEVGHPPGNPIWMLTARFFVNFAGGDMSQAALMVNVMSALLSAGTILLLFWTITHLVRRIIVKDDASEISLTQMIVIFGAGLCGSLAFTWSDTFWFSAVEGEVYAFSSFCTALVFWLILKWENRADNPISDRYLLLIAYVIGISIAVHLLNLLCIPAIGLVIYYRKFKDTNVKGSLIALGVSCVVVGLILYGLVPGFVEMAQYFELFFVNSCGMSFNTGTFIYAFVLVALFIWNIYELYTQKSIARIKILTCTSIFFSGMPFIGDNIVIPIVFMIGLIAYFVFASKLPIRILSIAVTSVFVIFIGYSSYALLLIRANANTPMNQNAPDNVFALASYLNREQYGQRPLFHGTVFAEEEYEEETQYGKEIKYRTINNIDFSDPSNYIIEGADIWGKAIKTNPDDPDKYIVVGKKRSYKENPDLKMLFPRIYSTDPNHVIGYKGWSTYNPKEAKLKNTLYLSHDQTQLVDGYVRVPSFTDNLTYFINYQCNHMYWRYFMWNFAGRQNDIQGNGEVIYGNWISGIPAIDNLRLGDQSLLPEEFGTGNKGHNVYYMLPLLLGIIGILWQTFTSKRSIEHFWVIFFLFFMTGLAIVLYLNQTPGQPRERDYAFAGSFYAFAIWIGLAVPGIWAGVKALLKKKDNKASQEESSESKQSFAIAVVAAIIGIIVPLQMVSQTWDDHDRSGRYTARDFGKNYLSSVDKNGIIFVNGDNDTFPLWYAQEVEGYRTDVKVVNLSYLSTDWYANQIQHPTYEAPAIDMYSSFKDYGNDAMAYCEVRPVVANSMKSAKEVFTEMLNDPNHVFKYDYVYIPVDSSQVIRNNVVNKIYHEAINDTMFVRIGNRGSLALNQSLPLDMIAKNAENGWTRPIYYAVTVPNSYHLGLTPYLQQTGMAYQVTPAITGVDGDNGINVDKMYDVVTNKYLWGGLDKGKDLYLDETVRRMVTTTRGTLLSLADELYINGMIEVQNDSTNKVAGKEYFDKARNVLHLLEEKLPASAMPFEHLTELEVARLYLKLSEQTGNKDDMNRAKTIVDGSFNRYVKHIPYLMSLNDYQLSHIIHEEQHIPNRALPHLITLWQQVGGDIDKKLKELGISITDVMGLRLRFLQCENPNRDIIAFIPSMIEYYNMLNYKPENYIDALAQLFGKYNLSRNDIETILSKAVAKHAQAE